MNRLTGLVFVAALAIGARAAAQHSAWLPGLKGLVVTPSYVYQTFDQFWRSGDKVDLQGNLRQHAVFLGVDYGITEDIALDATVGWVWNEVDGIFGDASDHGLTDTTFGVRQQFIDETVFNLWWLPSLAARIGGTIEGTYDENAPFPPGDGASGAEVSLLAGKTILSGFGLFGDVGYRYRDGNVPDELFGAAGIFLSWNFLGATAAYRFSEGLSGNDIGDAGFTFPTVKETSRNLEVSLGFKDPGGRYYQVFYAHTIAGRNTGQRDIFGASISVTW